MLAFVKKFNDCKWLLLILLAAFILRLPNRDGKSLYWYSELLRDIRVEKNLAGGHLIFYGPPSHLGGFNFGPIYYYLLFPFTAGFHFALFAPALASLFFSLAAITASFFILKKWHSIELAYITATIICICEFDISFAKYASNPNFLPFFALIFFYSFQQLIEKQNIYRNTFLLSVSFAVATQLHAVALISLPVILLIALARKDIYLSLRQWLIFILTNLFIYFPYLYFEATHKWVDFTGLLHLAGSSVQEGVFSRIVEYFGFWFSPWVISHLDFDIFYIAGRIFLYIIALILIIGYGIFKFNQSRIKSMPLPHIKLMKSVKITLLYWLVVPSCLLLLPIGSVTSLLIFYFFILTPLLYFFYGWLFYLLFQNGWQWVGYYVIAVFIGLQVFEYIVYNLQLSKLML